MTTRCAKKKSMGLPFLCLFRHSLVHRERSRCPRRRRRRRGDHGLFQLLLQSSGGPLLARVEAGASDVRVVEAAKISSDMEPKICDDRLLQVSGCSPYLFFRDVFTRVDCGRQDGETRFPFVSFQVVKYMLAAYKGRLELGPSMGSR